MKYIYKLLALSSVFTILLIAVSCDSDNDIEPLFDQSINERTEALKTEYLEILTSPENGWLGYYSPNESFGFYTVLLKFDDGGNVDINSDYNSGSASNTITYRVDKSLKIELVFESTSVFSEIFAINRNNNAGEFVFNILSANQNEVVLESKLDFGDDVTIFTLRRARSDELDLTPVYNSVQNITGDGTESVFRNILFNDEVIGTFSFNPSTRFTTISYVQQGVVQTINVPIIITSTGFSFETGFDINGVVLTSFEYNNSENYYENPADAVKIIYDNIPGIPLDVYGFNVENEAAVFNMDEMSKHSLGFSNFYEQFSMDLAANTTLPDLEISNIIFWELNTAETPYLDVRTNYGNVYYDLDFTFDSQTGIVVFNLTGGTNAPVFFTELIQPLLDVLVGSTNGYYAVNSGTYLFYPNKTFSLINADTPNIKIDYWAF